MEPRFEIGDVVRRKNGQPFKNGKIEATVGLARFVDPSLEEIDNYIFVCGPDRYIHQNSLELVRNQAMRTNHGKTKFSLVPRSAIQAIAEALEFGVKKYARDDWRKGLPYTEVLDSTYRHLYAWAECDDIDKDSNLSHLFHAMANLTFLIEYSRTNTGTDDRYRG